MKFNPAEITVQKGDTVIWKNNDMVAHCVRKKLRKHGLRLILQQVHHGKWQLTQAPIIFVQFTW